MLPFFEDLSHKGIDVQPFKSHRIEVHHFCNQIQKNLNLNLVYNAWRHFYSPERKLGTASIVL